MIKVKVLNTIGTFITPELVAVFGRETVSVCDKELNCVGVFEESIDKALVSCVGDDVIFGSAFNKNGNGVFQYYHYHDGLFAKNTKQIVPLFVDSSGIIYGRKLRDGRADEWVRILSSGAEEWILVRRKSCGAHCYSIFEFFQHDGTYLNHYIPQASGQIDSTTSLWVVQDTLFLLKRENGWKPTYLDTLPSDGKTFVSPYLSCHIGDQTHVYKIA